MKKILPIAALLVAAVPAFAGTPIKYEKKTATVLCSQGFQGPEEWDKEVYSVDSKGYISIFDGESLRGWRNYGTSAVSPKWSVEDGAIHFNPKTEGPRGDIIFAHNFRNFELSLEWKISEGGNSGIFYLGRETADKDGNLNPLYISCPECQVLDNENHPDAKLGVDGNRMAGSLYDLIPAKPQNAKPHGEWNKVVIRVENGHVTHFQNGAKVLEYDLWTPQWDAMLQNSKFAENGGIPGAFELLSDCGGENHEGMIGLQDHGDDVWYRNIKVREL